MSTEAWDAEIVAVGDELLSGAGVNRNAAWLGRRLGEVDVRVRRGTVVGDDVDVVADAIRTAAARSDLVLVTGGLGPTSDDRTRDALAAALGTSLERDEATAARITSWYAERGRTPTESVLTQADVPVGAHPLLNTAGTAPGLSADLDGAIVVCLPGVPAEVAAIMEGSVLPLLASRSGGKVAIGAVRTALVPETVVASTIADIEARATDAGIAVAYLPSVAQVLVRFVAPSSVPANTGAVAVLVEQAASLLGDCVVSIGTGSLADEVVRLAAERLRTVAVAESLTGGLVTAALVDVAGASAVLRGGVVAYATELKADLLDVDEQLLADVGAVDEQVARRMAEGVRVRLGADYGVATTGVAGPDAQDGKVPGTVHVAVAGPEGTVVLSPVLRGDRERIRAATVTHALELLRRSLRGLPPPTL